jgi:hypothetical protein
VTTNKKKHRQQAKVDSTGLNNPISKLYEYCKQQKLPEPMFETVAENVVEMKATNQGYAYKRSEFTIQVSTCFLLHRHH